MTNPPAPGEQTARDAFARSYASGRKRWNLENVIVTYSKSNGRGSTPIESWTATCNGTRPLTMSGNYPNVALNLAAVDCGVGRKPRELDNVAFIGADMSYEARHIPAYPSEPNQFRLNLRGFNSFGVFRWTSTSSLNANAKDRVAFFDFVGEEADPVERRDTSNHFLSVAIERDATTPTRARLRVNYTLDRFLRSESSDVVITADLAPIR